MIGILSWILIGLIAGPLAGVLMIHNSRHLVNDLFIGILGAVANGFLACALLGDPLTGFNRAALMLAFLGSIFTVALLRSVRPHPPLP